MALDFFTAGLGAIGGILGAFGSNSAARDRAIAQEQVRTSIEIGNNARRTSAIAGARRASFGERNTFGRSSQARLLSDIADGLRNEESLAIQEFFNIADIRSQASRSRRSVLGGAIQGGISGFQFGSTLSNLDFLNDQSLGFAIRNTSRT